ncbi:MAG: DUF1792 domain-containing protein [Candidatus Nomurabacteria bacterium]|nr:DUF1792 domain-containing protein [Candidatus Nomurabacteria bacterium]USN88124.1 MAG: DUF1792 domain-containing protein [Candidatus Nomurabacteria bacterium]
MKKLITTIVNGIRYEPVAFFHYCLSFLIYPHSVDFHKKTPTELKDDLKKGKSLIRVGDGEAMLLMGRSIHFQTFDNKLRSDLKQIVTEYNPDSNYVLAVPHFALTEPFPSLKKRSRNKIWRLFRVLFKRLFNNQSAYADAVMFYHKGVFESTILPIISDKKVLVLAMDSVQKPLTKYFNKHSIDFSFVPVPISNAFFSVTYLMEQVKNLAKNKNATVLIAAGPAGKVLAYRVLEHNIQCIDIGHGIEILGQEEDYSSRL